MHPLRTQYVLLSGLLALLLASCIDAGAGECIGDDCACAEGTAVTCFLPPEFEGDQMICQQGIRQCRGGELGPCEVDTRTVRAASAALITGPTTCNPCAPQCAFSESMPDNSDLDASNSDNVEYSPTYGGLVVGDGTVVTPLADSDGDGVPDIVDAFPMNPSRDGITDDGGIYHTLPLGGPPELDPLNISVQVRAADVYFLMDTTGSMGGEINNLRSSLSSGTFLPGCPGGVIGAIRCTIPDAHFGVGHYDDFPVSPYGWPGYDVVYRNLLNITSSVSAAQTAVNSLPLHFGNDIAESTSQALWAVATGNNLGRYSSSATCFGGFGMPCFRTTALPIIILMTDAPIHNGPQSGFDYDPGRFGGSYAGVRWNAAVNALNARNIKVITLYSGPNFYQRDVDDLADATGSVDSAGNRYVFPIASNGTGLDTSIVDAVVDLANYVRMDVSIHVIDNASTVFDERTLVAATTPVGFGPGNCASFGGTVFQDCLPGTQVDYEVTFQNTTVPPSTSPQVFEFDIVLRGDGVTELARVPVVIVVPPALLLDPGTFVREFDAEAPGGDGRPFCELPLSRPLWSIFNWSGDTPGDSELHFEFRTADDAADLDTAPPVIVDVPPGPDSGSVDVGALLTGAGQLPNLAYLRVTSVLVPTSDRSTSPVLYNTDLEYFCLPNE